MAYLLNFAYLGLLCLASPWLLYSAFRKGKYRQGFTAKFLGRVPIRKGDAQCIWLHAVSVGEVNVLAPLLKRLKSCQPRCEIVISTTTKTGYELATKKYRDHTVFYCPLDFSWAVATAMRRIRPTALVLAELELWPNLIAEAKRQGAKIAVINGRLSEKSARGYGRIRWFVRRILQSIDMIAVQNSEYANRFQSLGAGKEKLYMTGSIKFDGAQVNRQNPDTRRLATLGGISDRDIVFLAGSTQSPEEQMALNVYKKIIAVHPRLKLVIVPRHPERFAEVADILEQSEICWQRRSELMSGNSNPDARVLLVDAIGELGAWWGTARIAFVGGSMGKRGGQNMIEPAAYGAAVSFGPKTRNFRDVVSMMLMRDAAVVVHNSNSLEKFVTRCLDDGEFADALGQNAQQLVRQQKGAADRTVTLISALLSGESHNLKLACHAA